WMTVRSWSALSDPPGRARSRTGTGEGCIRGRGASAEDGAAGSRARRSEHDVHDLRGEYVEQLQRHAVGREPGRLVVGVTRADVEHAARVIAAAEHVLFPPRSECTTTQVHSLRSFEDRARVALPTVFCKLVGVNCTCWTNEQLLAADRGSR